MASWISILSPLSARRRSSTQALLVAATLSCAAGSLRADPAGWALNWQDDFVGTAIDAGRWERLTRRDSFNNEKQYYLANQVSVANGNMRITATNQPFEGKAYRSGLIRTWGEQTFGRWEIRASLPTTQGMWPAIWLLPRNANWPTGGEIDIMENRGSQPTSIGSAYHFGSSVANHQYIGESFSYSVNGTPVSFHGSMHTYAVEWDASRIRYLVDGIPHYTFYQNAAPISSTPMSLIINLAIGGDYGGDPNASTVFPQYMDVDYVRNYTRSASARSLNNAGFETTAGDHFAEWDEFSNGANVRIDPTASNARTGTKAVQMYGRFNNTTQNNSGLFQEMPTTPGEVWQVGAWSANRAGDALAGNNTAGVKIEFIDANGNVIDAGALTVADRNSPTAYRESLVRRTAPANAKFVRAVLEMVQRSSAGGSVNFDDAHLRRWTPSSLAGDINLDGSEDSADLDALLHSLALVNTSLDFNADGFTNVFDVDYILATAFGTVRGDLNLDQSVDFDDLLALAQNYSAQGTGNWSRGDIDGDSNVDFDDLLALAQTYGTGSNLLLDSTLNAQFEADWALARSIVPEPAAAVAIVSLTIVGRRRRPISQEIVFSR